jgi:hypothetical protein
VRRVVALAAYATSVFVAVSLALPLLRDAETAPPPAEPSAAVAQAEPPARPATVPARIPAWAWGLSRWHDDRLGNVRPLEAPRRVPAWYWEWREWRKALAPG